MLYIVLAYLMMFAALTNSVCLNNASFFFFLFKYFLCQGYELSGEIALKNNHYYYYYYFILGMFLNCKFLGQFTFFCPFQFPYVIFKTLFHYHVILQLFCKLGMQLIVIMYLVIYQHYLIFLIHLT